MKALEALDMFYQPNIIIGPGQAYAICAAIAAARPSANVLVFGCGNDSPLWNAANPGGHTLFVENDREWLQRTASKYPELNIEEISYFDTTVEGSAEVDEAVLSSYPMPDVLRRRAWDVILVDSPVGFKPLDRGRSLSIYWASMVAGTSTQVFIDDYNRPLERRYADYFFRNRRPWNVEIPRLVARGRRAKGKMLWSMGVPNVVSDAVLEPRFKQVAYKSDEAT